MKKKAILVLPLLLAIVIVAVVFAVHAANPQSQTITGRCLVTMDGTYLIVDENDSPIVLNNRSGRESLFHNLNNGDMISITCDIILTTYPGQTNVTQCKLISKGSLHDISKDTLSALREMGWTFEAES